MPEAAVAEAKKVSLSSDEQTWSRTTSDFLLSEIINVEVHSDRSGQSEAGFCIRHPQISYFTVDKSS